MHHALSDSVRLHQLRLYVDNHLHDRYLAPPLTLVVAGLLTLWVPVWQAALWAGLEWLVIAAYISVYLRCRAAAMGPQDEARWARRIAWAHGAHMALWSSIVVWAYQPGNVTSLMFVMLVHVGLISLTVVMSNPYRRLLLSDLAAPTVALLAPPLLDGTLFSLGLTALSNRNHFVVTGQMELQRAARYRHTLALLMVDIDHFKPANDTHGHLAGDEVLKAVARVCGEQVRANDCLARLGGEEFALLMPETSLEQACAAAERLREAVSRIRCELPDAVITPTVSVGVAVAASDDETLSSLMRRGDRAMYDAKAGGRNCVKVALAP